MVTELAVVKTIVGAGLRPSGGVQVAVQVVVQVAVDVGGLRPGEVDAPAAR